MSDVDSTLSERGARYGNYSDVASTTQQLMSIVECGVKTRWKGANKLMDEYFHEVAGPGFKIVKQPYIVTCFSAFKNVACQREFKAVQISLTGNGLGVINQ